MSSRKQNLILCHLWLDTERYSDATGYIKSVIEEEEGLDKEEKRLFFVTYTNFINQIKATIDYIDDMARKSKEEDKSYELEVIKKYREKVRKEMVKIWEEGSSLIDKYLLPKTQQEEDTVFYLKFSGDFYRYLAEYSDESSQPEYKNKAELAYEEATLEASWLKVIHAYNIELATSFAEFCQNILKDSERAYKIASEVFERAIEEMHTLEEEEHSEVSSALEALRILMMENE
jgi:14-3-3 protein epsilon